MPAAIARDGLGPFNLAAVPTMRLMILAGLALVLATAPLPLAAQEIDPPRGVTVVGAGEVRARPDLAVVRIGVVSQASTARAALDANNAAMRDIMAALAKEAIAGRDVQTSQFSVQPRYRHDPDNQLPPRIDGYEVSNQLAVVIRDLDKLGPVLDLAVSVGSNQILGVEFSLADPEPRRDEARRLAVADAVRKAELYAAAAKIELGASRAITEQAFAGPPQPLYRRMEMSAEPSVPIAEGEQAIAVEVTINWGIGRD
jgi:uncharacterized protein YggE